MRALFSAVLVTFVLVLAACGGSDSGAESSATGATAVTTEATAVTTEATNTKTGEDSTVAELGDAFGAMLWESRPDRPSPFNYNEDDAKCMGRVLTGALVEQVGYETLVDAGVTAEAVEQGSVNLGALIDNDDFDLLILEASIECIDLIGELAAEVSQNSGWRVRSWSCFFDGLLAEETTRRVVAVGIFTVGDLGVTLENIDPVILFDLFFACMTDEELTEFLVADSGLGVSEQSLSCLVNGFLAEETTREAFRQRSIAAENLQDTLENLSRDQGTAEAVDDLVNICLTDEEQATLGL